MCYVFLLIFLSHSILRMQLLPCAQAIHYVKSSVVACYLISVFVLSFLGPWELLSYRLLEIFQCVCAACEVGTVMFTHTNPQVSSTPDFIGFHITFFPFATLASYTQRISESEIINNRWETWVSLCMCQYL